MERWGPNNSAGTFARMCLPTGLNTVIFDSSTGTLYGGSDRNIYCVDLCKYAIQETLGGSWSTCVNVRQNNSGSDALSVQCNNCRGREKNGHGKFETLLSGRYVLCADTIKCSTICIKINSWSKHLHQSWKDILDTFFSLLDLADLVSLSSSTWKSAVLWASGINDGTLRVWDLQSRSCISIVRGYQYCIWIIINRWILLTTERMHHYIALFCKCIHKSCPS